MSLYAEIKDAELLRRSIHELGTVFYTENENGIINKVAYFSGTRIVIYEGTELPQDLLKLIKAVGAKVRVLEYDEITRSLKVKQ